MMKKNISLIVDQLFSSNHNISCNKETFIEELIFHLENYFNVKVSYVNGDLFFGTENVLDYLVANSMNNLLTSIFKSIILEFTKLPVEENSMIHGKFIVEKDEKNLLFDIPELKTTAILPTNFTSPGDNFQPNKFYYLIVEKIKTEGTVNLIVSRNKSILVKKMFEKLCNEIDKIEIVSISREPGIQTKILVQSKNEDFSGTLSLIGKNSEVINSISRELNENIQVFEMMKERINETYSSLLFPIQPEEIKVDEESITYFVNQNDFSKAIGKKGINVKLISMLIHKKVFIKVKE